MYNSIATETAAASHIPTGLACWLPWSWIALFDTVEVGQPNVRNSGVHVRPVVDHAVCFSNVDPQVAYTEHSGYPQHEAEKKVINPMDSNVFFYKENLWGSSYACRFKHVPVVMNGTFSTGFGFIDSRF
jgi:hypothetical protein